MFAASKIELFNSNEDTNTVTDVANINWEYLGYITLSDNQSSAFKSRELKSAKVPTCVVTFVKLKLGKNHSNSYNTYNQVSLIAINVLGTEIEMRRSSTTGESLAEKLSAILNDPEYTSPYDDLAFDMYVDTEVAKIIREMEIKKHTAVISKLNKFITKIFLFQNNCRTILPFTHINKLKL